MSSISERIAALQKKTETNGALPPLDVTRKSHKNSAIAERIASLEKTAGHDSSKDTNSNDTPKPGRLAIPVGGAIPIPIMGGPPPSLIRKQKEREERNRALREQAQEDESKAAASNEGGETRKVGKLKLPHGAVPILPMGCGPPPALLKKQKDGDHSGSSALNEFDRQNAEEAIMSRPIIEAKRRSPNR